MIEIINEDFSDFKLGELPYDKGHTALGEYHYIKKDGYFGNWYDPISLHQWRSCDGSWLITEDNGVRFLEQNRGDNSFDAFKNVYACLVHKNKLYSYYTLKFNLRIFELNQYCGMAFCYKTSRNYYAVGVKGNIISLYRRYQENFEVISSCEVLFDDFKTYSFKVDVSKNVCVYLDDKLILTGDIDFDFGFVACVSKSLCRYSNIIVTMEDDNYKKHLENLKAYELKLKNKSKMYPKLKCIKKIDLQSFGSGRQLRISDISGKTVFVLAQHQKRYIRDSFAHLSSMTCFDIDGNILWQIGEPCNSIDNTLISCDLPFQIADINNDGKKEVIYARNFEVCIIDLETGSLIKKMKTPIIYNDPLVKNEPFYRLNVDAIRVADFEGLGYKGDFIIKDRYQNVWAYNHNMELMWRYNHKNTGHFPYIYDFDNDGFDEMFVGYDLVDHDGKIIFSLPMNSDHTDEIIYARLKDDEPKRLILASGNEGMNIVNLDGTIYKHNEIGHAQRISVSKYLDIDGLQICATAFWGSDGIVCMYDCHGNLLYEIEMQTDGCVITPVNYDGKHILILSNASSDGGLLDGELDKVVKFDEDGHPTLCCEVYDVDHDGIDEIICWDLNRMWIYKADKVYETKEFEKYPDEGFSNYRGEYLIYK